MKLDHKILLFILVFMFPFDAISNAGDCRSLYILKKAEAFDVCYNEADSGNQESRKILGDMYYWGWGYSVKKDYKKAMLWYMRSAKRGNIEAKYNLGVMYEKGLGTSSDFVRSARWYLSAANDGHIYAQYNIANMLSKGAGIRINKIKSSMWYERAANQGDVISQYNIGNRYLKGIGVSKDIIKAYMWYYIASESGYEDAKKNLVIIEPKMTTDQVIKSKTLAENWKPELE